MNKMKVEQSSQGVYPTSILIDGGGLLHKVHWPTGGAVKDLIDGIERYIRKLIPCSDVYIIFDRYKVDSIKNTRCKDWLIPTNPPAHTSKRATI